MRKSSIECIIAYLNGKYSKKIMNEQIFFRFHSKKQLQNGETGEKRIVLSKDNKSIEFFAETWYNDFHII